MICGIGVDAVEINRFAHWQNYPEHKLRDIFSAEEVTYCLSVPTKSAERFAARFAAKEAFFKAWHSYVPTCSLSLKTVCTKVNIAKNNNDAPLLVVDWTSLCKGIAVAIPTNVLLSLTHTENTATALVVLELSSKMENTNTAIAQETDCSDEIWDEDEDLEQEEEDIPLEDETKSLQHIPIMLKGENIHRTSDALAHKY